MDAQLLMFSRLAENQDEAPSNTILDSKDPGVFGQLAVQKEFLLKWVKKLGGRLKVEENSLKVKSLVFLCAAKESLILTGNGHPLTPAPLRCILISRALEAIGSVVGNGATFRKAWKSY